MDIKDLLYSELEKGNIVYRDVDGLCSIKLSAVVNQPSDGILYDLNRDEVTILQFTDNPKWINDFACAQIIRYLKSENEKLKKELEDFKKSYIQ